MRRELASASTRRARARRPRSVSIRVGAYQRGARPGGDPRPSSARRAAGTDDTRRMRSSALSTSRIGSRPPLKMATVSWPIPTCAYMTGGRPVNPLDGGGRAPAISLPRADHISVRCAVCPVRRCIPTNPRQSRTTLSSGPVSPGLGYCWCYSSWSWAPLDASFIATGGRAVSARADMFLAAALSLATLPAPARSKAASAVVRHRDVPRHLALRSRALQSRAIRSRALQSRAIRISVPLARAVSAGPARAY